MSGGEGLTGATPEFLSVAGGCGPWRIVHGLIRERKTGAGKMNIFVVAAWMLVVTPAAWASSPIIEGLKVNFLLVKFDGSEAADIPWVAIILMTVLGPVLAKYCVEVFIKRESLDS